MKKHFLLLSLIITALSLTAQRNVLVEELTGTWCQYCPGGIYYGDSLSHTYDNVYFVAVHTIDAMANEEYATHTGLTSAPAANIGRKHMNKSFDKWFETTLAYMNDGQEQSTVDVSATFEPGSRVVNITVSATAKSNMGGNYRFAAIVVEDAITGPAPHYNQANNYSGSSYYVGGFESLPNPVPAERMAYDHVGRHLISDFDGAEGSFPSSLNAGQTATYEFSYTLPEEYNEDYVRIIGLLVNQDTKEVDNAARTPYLNGSTNAAPIFTSHGKTEGFVGTAYNYNVFCHDTEGASLTITAVEKPEWLSFEQTDNKSGVMTGTPSQSGDYTVVLEANDGITTTTQEFVINVADGLEGNWEYVGERGFNSGNSYVHDMVFYGDTCYVLVQENDKPIVYRSVDDGEWEQLGNINTSMTYVTSTIDVTSTGEIYIGYSEEINYSYYGRVKKWDGSSWSDVGTVPNCFDIYLRIDSNDTPYFVCRHDGNWLGYLHKLVDGQWIEVGGGPINSSYTYWFSMDFDNNDNPYLLWSMDGNRAHVTKYENDEWVSLGEVSQQTVYYYMNIGINEDNKVFVAFNSNGTRGIDVYTFENEEWLNIGTNIGDCTTKHMDMVMVEGYPTIVYSDETQGNALSVIHYDGEAWEYIGPRAYTEGATSYPQIALRDTTYYVSFVEDDLGDAISVMKYQLPEPPQPPTAIAEAAANDIYTCYPTVANSTIIIESKVRGEAKIMNINGSVVMSTNISEGANEIEVRHLARGMYIIDINGIKTKIIR